MRTKKRKEKSNFRKRDRRLRLSPRIGVLEERVMLDGSLDSTFGAGGLVTTALGATLSRAPLVIGGFSTHLSHGEVVVADAASSPLRVSRYDESGRLDTTFGNNGVVTTPVLDDSYARSVTVSGSSVIAAGIARSESSQSESEYSPVLVEYDVNGALDGGFGTRGVLVIDPKVLFATSSTMSVSVTAVATQSDGKILLAGYGSVPGGNGPATSFVTRYTAAGVLDTTFGDAGVLKGQIGGQSSTLTAMSISPLDDKVSLAIDAGLGYTVVRLTRDGKLDDSFGSGGVATVELKYPGGSGIAQSLAFDLQGELYAAGTITTGAVGIIKLTSAGTLDAKFGSGGILVGDFKQGGVFENAYPDIAVQADGRLLIASYGMYAGRADFVLARYNPTGSLDAAFGSGGLVHTDFSTPGSADYTRDDVATAVVLSPDGKEAVVAGLEGFYSSTPGPRLALARYVLDDPTIAVPPPSGTLRLDSSADSGSSSNDGITNKKILTFSGVHKTIPSAYLELVRDDSTVVDYESTSETLTDPGPIPEGSHRYSVRQLSAFFRTSASTSPVNVVVDRTPPAVPPAPVLDPSSDTGTPGDDTTTSTKPKLTGTADPNTTVTLFDDAGKSLASAQVGGSGHYSLQISSALSLGSHVVHIRAMDVAGNSSTASKALSLTIVKDTAPTPITPKITPTLIVSVHGQEQDLKALGALVMQGALGVFGGIIPGAALTYDAVNGISATGSGRQLDPWQDDIGTLAQVIFQANDANPSFIESLEVDWDTYGSEHDPAQEVARQINAIVADTQYDGSPWDILFVGYSRGGPFVHEILKGLDLVSNPRIDYTEAILLDPTASKVSGDVFPASMPPGLDREIVYDDGYAFPLTQLSFHLLGKEYDVVELTNDGNSGNRVAGAEYRYERDQIQKYIQEDHPDVWALIKKYYIESHVGSNALDSYRSHLGFPYWYMGRDPYDDPPLATQFKADLIEFLKAKDQGAALNGGTVTLLDHTKSSPASTAPNFKNASQEAVQELTKFANSLIDDAKRFAAQIAKEAEKLGKDIAAAAKKAGDALVADAKKLGGEALAEAKKQAAALARTAQAEINKLEADAKKTADALYKEGKLFDKSAAKEVDKASKQLASVQKQSAKVVAKAQKDADKAVAAVKKAVGDKLKKAQEAAKAAAAKVAAATAKAEADARAAAAKLAVAANNARIAAEQEAAKIAAAASSARDRVSSGISNVRKKFHF
ncbi:Ig-like domain-containing protein [Paludisphaera rhizosphaerae]|uniref:Ig-like domain-containing protein n=1 Tax=Paludisphaera rhizosphaerae TaxID=2711216 RepID=UPI0013EBD794|nr:Ig-like domain-containing protein [Paludisphaera rhizosphaerae]